MIEDQIGVLQAIAKQPGSIIKDEKPHRAGKPLRYRTVKRLLDMGDLSTGRGYNSSGTDVTLGYEYITLTSAGWERITNVDKV